MKYPNNRRLGRCLVVTEASPDQGYHGLFVVNLLRGDYFNLL